MLEENRYNHDAEESDIDNSSDSASTNSSKQSITRTTTTTSYEITTTDITFHAESTHTKTNNTTNTVSDDNDVTEDNKEENTEDTGIATTDDTGIDTTAVKESTNPPTKTSPDAEIHEKNRITTESNGRVFQARKDAARLSAKLGHITLVDSVVVRKRARDRAASQGEFYEEIEKLAAAETDKTEKQVSVSPDLSPTADKVSLKSDSSDNVDKAKGDGTPRNKNTGDERREQNTSPTGAGQVASDTNDTFQDIDIQGDEDNENTPSKGDNRKNVSSICCCFTRRMTSNNS